MAERQYAAPSDTDAERTLLGAVILENQALHRVAKHVAPEDFFKPAHRLIYEAMGSLSGHGDPIDLMTLRVELQRLGVLEQVGGPAYVSSLIDGLPYTANFDTYAHIIRHKAELRAIAKRGNDLAKAALEPGASANSLRERALGIATECHKPVSPAASSLPPWHRFPTERLPDGVSDYVREVAAAIGCDESMVAVSALTTLAGVIGNHRTIRLKNSWTEPAVLWAVIVARSGALKSPSLGQVTAPLQRFEEQEAVDYQLRYQQHKRALQAWDDTSKTKRGPRPEAPKPGVRLLVSDTTVEALTYLLSSAPAGLLLVRDELAAWILGFDRYRKGRGSDAQAFLEMHRAGCVVVDRKGSDRIVVPRAAVSILGTIQPRVLRKVLAGDNTDNGLAARLLFAMPPQRLKIWSEADLSEPTRDAFARLLNVLRALPFEPRANNPIDLSLDKQAKKIFVKFYNDHGIRESEAETEALASAFSKLEGYTARFALIDALVRDPEATQVGAVSMRNGVELATWFANEAERVYAMFSETPQDHQRRMLIDWISDRGGVVTERDLTHGLRRYRQGDGAARIALIDLVAAGYGDWHERRPGRQGGRPTREFRLRDCGSGTETNDADSTDGSSETPVSIGSEP